MEVELEELSGNGLSSENEKEESVKSTYYKPNNPRKATFVGTCFYLSP